MKKWIREFLCDKFFNVHDRSTELRESTPENVRAASHALNNATMNVEAGAQLVRKQADALTALVVGMQKREDNDRE